MRRLPAVIGAAVAISGCVSAPLAESFAAETSPITVSVSDGYGTNVAAGSWVPVDVTVSNAGGDFRGYLTVSTAAPETNGCPVGIPVGCPAIAFGSPSSSSRQISYRLALQVAAGTTKHLVVDVVAVSGGVRASVSDTGGAVVNSTSGNVGVSFGNSAATVAVVSDQASAVQAFGGITIPGSGQLQVVGLAPADLPGAAAVLATFSAVILDDASTQSIDPPQRAALQQYVATGGTLVVCTGIGASSTLAGLPAALVPARVSGTGDLALSRLSSFLGVAPLAGTAEVSGLSPTSGQVTASEGSAPLVVEAGVGAGRVVLTAFDPSASPFVGWSGLPTLIRRLILPAADLAAGTLTGSGSSNYTLLGASGAIASNASDIPPFSLPSTTTMALLLFGYVLLVGPVNFWLLARWRRRDLGWVTVPALSLLLLGVSYVSGLGRRGPPVLNEVRLIEATGTTAQVDSYGAVYLGHGGSQQVRLAPGSMVTAFGDGTLPPQVQLGSPPNMTLAGGTNTLVGFAAAHQAALPGGLVATLQNQGGVITGTVTNRLGVRIGHLAAVNRAGQEQNLGSLAPGASVQVDLSAAGTPANSHTVSIQPAGWAGIAPLKAMRAGVVAFAGPGGRPGTPAQQLLGSVEELASAQQADVTLVGLAAAPLLPADVHDPGVTVRDTDAIVEPVTPSPGAGSITALPGQLVDESGLYNSSPVSGTVRAGGWLMFRWLLPAAAWGSASVKLDAVPFVANTGPMPPGAFAGPPGSAPTGGYSVAVFNPGTGHWDSAGTVSSGGTVTIPDPGRHVSASGGLTIRLSAVGAAPVSGYPTLTAGGSAR